MDEKRARLVLFVIDGTDCCFLDRGFVLNVLVSSYFSETYIQIVSISRDLAVHVLSMMSRNLYFCIGTI